MGSFIAQWLRQPGPGTRFRSPRGWQGRAAARCVPPCGARSAGGPSLVTRSGSVVAAWPGSRAPCAGLSPHFCSLGVFRAASSYTRQGRASPAGAECRSPRWPGPGASLHQHLSPSPRPGSRPGLWPPALGGWPKGARLPVQAGAAELFPPQALSKPLPACGGAPRSVADAGPWVGTAPLWALGKTWRPGFGTEAHP